MPVGHTQYYTVLLHCNSALRKNGIPLSLDCGCVVFCSFFIDVGCAVQ